MPPQKRSSTAHRSTKSRSVKATLAASKSAKSQRRRTKTRALAVSDAVLREAVGGARLPNPLQVFEPLRKTIVDRQIAFLGMVMAWSPARIIVNQQAAFWEGVANDAGSARVQSPEPARKAKKRR